jgi:dihydrolipoamide dehydrogenase
MVNLNMYDLIIIGAGPGGYISAIKAAELGQKVAVIEQKYLGGTCLNVGCIPSKAYLQHSKWAETVAAAKPYGLDMGINQVDFPKLVDHKDQVVNQLKMGVQFLFKKHKVDYIEGTADVLDANHVVVAGTTYECQNILLATGSHPFVPPIPGLDQANYVTTDEFFSNTQLPKELVIIGAGIISVELAFAMAPLGVKVTLLEVAPDMLLVIDEDARDLIKARLTELDITWKIGVTIDQVTPQSVQLADGSAYHFDQLLVATGRRADLKVANSLGLKLDDAGRVVSVDDHYQTSIPHIYAIGDLIGGYMLAHVAGAEGIKAVSAIAGQPQDPVDPNFVPRCLYSEPEVGSFGLSVQEAKDQGYDVKVSQVPFATNGKAIATGATTGFIKLISETKYHQILGGVIAGHNATEMIHTLITTAQAEGTVDEIANSIFAHPTLSELIGDSANTLLGQSVNS